MVTVSLRGLLLHGHVIAARAFVAWSRYRCAALSYIFYFY
jgi:hypothetical protein